MTSSAPWRARTVPQLLDGGCRLLHRRGRSIMAIVAVVVLPIELVAALALAGTGPGGSFPVFGPFLVPEASTGAELAASMALFALRSIALVLVAGPIAHVAAADAFGHSLPARQAWRAARGRLPAQLAAWCLAKPLMIVAGCTTYVGWVFFSALFLVTAPAIALEGLGPVRGLKRSWRLTARRYGTALVFVLASALVSTMVVVAVGGVAALGVVVQPLAALDWLFAIVAAILASLVSVPIVVCATVLLYIDLRTRTEGVDLVIEAREIMRA